MRATRWNSRPLHANVSAERRDGGFLNWNGRLRRRNSDNPHWNDDTRSWNVAMVNRNDARVGRNCV